MENKTIKCKVVMLPQNQKAIVGTIVQRPSDNKLAIVNVLTVEDPQPRINQHLYITSDREIKENDWIYDLIDKVIYKANNQEAVKRLNSEVFKKIEATTDTSLFQFGSCKKCDAYQYSCYLSCHNLGGICQGKIIPETPQIPQSFIKAYVDAYNSSKVIEDVLIELNPRPDNTVIIHSIKNSWNREEMIELLQDLFNEASQDNDAFYKDYGSFEDYIKQNL